MKSKTGAAFGFTVLLGALTFLAHAVAQDREANQLKLQHYTLTNLGTLGGSLSEGVGINNYGAVSGNSLLTGDSVHRGFFWKEGVMTDLGTLGGPNSVAPEAWAPNERDQVAGFSDTAELDPNQENFCSLLGFFPSPYICRGFVWRRGVLTPMPTLGGNNSAATSINNRGQLTGITETTVMDPSCFAPQLFDFVAVIWEPESGKLQELAPLSGDNETFASGINDNGQAVGTSATCAAGPIEAVLWEEGKPTNLGSLGGTSFNIAFGINNRGQIVGQSDLPGDASHHAVLWQKGEITDLGTIHNLPNSLASSINNKGQIVGFSQINDFFSTIAWIWQDGAMTDLNTLIPAGSPWFLVEALGINDRGQITGIMFNTITGEVPGFVLTPVENATEHAPLAPGVARPVPVLSDNVRQLLQRKRGLFSRGSIR